MIGKTIDSGRILLFQRNDNPVERSIRTLAGTEGEPSLEDLPDADLVELLRALDDDAWAEVYRRHARQVYEYAYRRIGDQHAAEDLAADVFVKAVSGIRGYRYRGTPLLAWLYRIAHNVTADYRRGAARRSEHTAAGGAEDVPERRDALRALDEHRDMMSAIGQLTDDQQQVVLLRFYQELSIAEVSRVVGKPEGAVKALQSRGLKSLRRFLDGGAGREHE